MAATATKRELRDRRRRRIRRKISGTAGRPRLSVYRSNVHIYAQLIDDLRAHTMVAASSRHVEPGENKSETSRRVGELLAERAREGGIEEVVFDRGGNAYEGRVAALADGARSGGLKF